MSVFFRLQISLVCGHYAASGINLPYSLMPVEHWREFQYERRRETGQGRQQRQHIGFAVAYRYHLPAVRIPSRRVEEHRDLIIGFGSSRFRHFGKSLDMILHSTICFSLRVFSFFLHRQTSLS